MFSVLPTAGIHEEASSIEKCWEMVDEITEDAMNSVAFLDISHEMLCSVLERDTLTVHEFNIYQAVDRWAEHQCKKQQREVSGEEKRKILGDAVNLIRFPLMSEEEFSSLVPKTKVLTEKDALDVLLYVNNAIDSPSKISDISRQGIYRIIKRVVRFMSVSMPSQNMYCGLWYDGRRPNSGIFCELKRSHSRRSFIWKKGSHIRRDYRKNSN